MPWPSARHRGGDVSFADDRSSITFNPDTRACDARSRSTAAPGCRLRHRPSVTSGAASTACFPRTTCPRARVPPRARRRAGGSLRRPHSRFRPPPLRRECVARDVRERSGAGRKLPRADDAARGRVAESPSYGAGVGMIARTASGGTNFAGSMGAKSTSVIRCFMTASSIRMVDVVGTSFGPNCL